MCFMLFGGLSGCVESNANMKTSSQTDYQSMVDAQARAKPRISPMTHIASGQMLERQGRYQAAVQQYEKAIGTKFSPA